VCTAWLACASHRCVCVCVSCEHWEPVESVYGMASVCKPQVCVCVSCEHWEPVESVCGMASVCKPQVCVRVCVL